MVKTIFVAGLFNILHPGHVRLLRFARELGDRLVVGVQSDRLAGEDAHVPEQLRLDGVRSNIFVNEAILIDEPIEVVIDRLRPDCVVKGREHEHRPNPEFRALNKYGGQLVFSSGDAVFSSLDLIRMDLLGQNRRISNVANDYLARHGIKTKDILAKISEFRTLRVCVIGDLIVDEYITCDPLGMSQEDPTLVVTPIDTQCFLGGSGIVAAHAAGLGAAVQFLSVTGKDDTRDYAEAELRRAGVEAHLFGDGTRPTTKKQRFRADGTTLLRVSHLHQASIDTQLQERILDRFCEAVSDCQLVIFSDFNYGCLPQTLVEKLVLHGRSSGVMMAADSQSSSQIGDVSRFKGMDLLTPTEHEARVCLRNNQDGLVVLADQLMTRSRAKNIILKLGSEGALLHLEGDSGGLHTDRIPGLNVSPRDVTGAGDSLLVGSALAMAAGATTWEAAYIGTIAAAVQLDRVGNIPLSDTDLIGWLRA